MMPSWHLHFGLTMLPQVTSCSQSLGGSRRAVQLPDSRCAQLLEAGKNQMAGGTVELIDSATEVTCRNLWLRSLLWTEWPGQSRCWTAKYFPRRT